MNFASFSDFLAMGRHGLFVWSAYGLCLLVLLINVAMPLVARQRFLKQQARRLKRENRW
ncbi:hemagglutination activity protein [Pseudomonas amygdali pv. tabaci str. ATCC 11528]|uniref:Heme exporter protein D n=20 Tax=Pseudomonas syringae group TaxID=136849 RepID=A0A3M2Z0G6_PSEAJ|nr:MULTISPECIES: heme exporter protein CcmD [Pseudomonas]KPB82884.1 Heme exporter protein D [Pseudomonas syringae pv. maculicola]KPX07035.1 Heme exporter protein D [Pseudomonas syringae pv. cunninghamiae]KPX68215.1 Heme exporter protein D [Pseudomonas amygdali pv. lachrymans]AAZ32998.1 heme exporter protein D [Pseudomonas savastanoi pv. phaseolicola 1448A]ARD11771.1 heme exporter protein CcmD [Pseudomonas savastanoi pv. savastanoi NCPPB 3335]